MEFSEKIGAATIRYKLIAERKGMRCMRQLLFATKKDNLVEKFTIQVYYKVSWREWTWKRVSKIKVEKVQVVVIDQRQLCHDWQAIKFEF